MAQYACKAGIRGGVARCRKTEPCLDHPNGQPPAPRPDRVLLKVNLNDRWERQFVAAGIRKVNRSPERADALAVDHKARAERLGRDPFAIREVREGQASDPESADSGCPVLGKNGLPAADIRGLVGELVKAGFRLTGTPHILARNWKPPVRLVLQFSREGEGVIFPWPLFGQLAATCFGQVDVWANDRDSRGLVVHTVNCGKRDDAAKPQFKLCYSGGDWAAEPIP